MYIGIITKTSFMEVNTMKYINYKDALRWNGFVNQIIADYKTYFCIFLKHSLLFSPTYADSHDKLFQLVIDV